MVQESAEAPMKRREDRIVLGATVGRSLSVLSGFPEHLAALGWEVYVVSAPGPELDLIGRSQGVTANPIEMTRNPHPLRDVKSLLAWCSYLNRLRPAVLFVGTPKAALLAMVAGVLTRVPRRIYILRGLRLESTTGWSSMVLKSMERLTAQSAHRVISVSPSLRAKALELRLTKPGKIHVLGHGSSNGVDLVRFRPGGRPLALVDEGLRESAPVIGFVGRLTNDKGLSVLAAARQILIQRGVDHQLLIVGGLDGDADDLEMLVATGRHAIETGHVSDTAPYYASMDVVVLPTLREGFPNTVLEAAASGLPVVTTTATGAVDSVVAGTTGWLVAAENSEALADALQAALAQPEERRRRGEEARRHVERHFAQADVWLRTVQLFTQGDDLRSSTQAPFKGHRSAGKLEELD